MPEEPEAVQSPELRWEAENWIRLQELFHLAQAAPPMERRRILEESVGDPVLLSRLADLLSASEKMEVEKSTESTEPEIETRLGPYALLRHLGTGGLGSVYLAERVVGGAVMQCAVKVLSPHAAGPAFEVRFQREQQILASLNHPNITRMLDAGISKDRRPYLAMEYVEGEDIVTYCDRNRLTVPQRLTLFRQICEAVAYAHRNLTVHLDLKPSNIMISTEGVVKLLDFGTSKLMGSEGVNTTTIMATPAYASPEQLRGEPVTTACDVYALGIILFELLAGKRPYRESSFVMLMDHALRGLEAPRITSEVTLDAAERRGVSENKLRQALKGDLSTIVARCLRSRPKDRYVSVDALSEDVRRYLSGLPVLARPQTFRYLIGKFVRRHWVGVLVSGLTCILLLAAGLFSFERERTAVRERDRAENMQNFLYRLFRLANSGATGKPAATVPEFLELGMRVLPDYIKNSADQREARLSLAESMYENGDMAGAHKAFLDVAQSAGRAQDHNAEAEAEAFAGISASQLGNEAEAEARTAHALELSHGPRIQPEVKVWSELYYGEVRENSGKRSDENLRLIQQSVTDAQGGGIPDREKAFAMYSLASDLEERGELDAADKLIRDSLAIYDRDPNALCDQSQMYADLGYIEGARGNYTASIPLFQKALDGSRRCAGPDSPATLLIQDYAAGALLHSGQAHAAVQMMEDALPRWRKSVKPGPQLANALFYTALAYRSDNDFAHAEPVAKEDVEMVRQFFAPQSHMVGSAEQVLTESLIGERKYAEALSHAEEAERILTATSHSPAQTAAAEKMHAERKEIEQKLNRVQQLPKKGSSTISRSAN
jgi:serine/threonine protein kinase/tetratricopeptide (TPR) repeat protein